MSNPLVSVVIPTYNRYMYLKDCIDACLSIQSEDLEIVVQDNTPNNKEMVSYINQINDQRLKYFHQSEHVSMSENCDLGISHASGDYVCLIGDDDCVCSNIIKVASLLKKEGIEGCIFPFPGFNWPDMTFENGHMAEANMFFRVNVDGKIMSIDTKSEIRKNVCQCNLAKMPHLYHSLVSKSCLDRVYNKVGVYSPGPSPDMAQAVAISLEIKNAVYLNDNLMVSGYGRASARGEGNRNEHFGNIEEKPWLPKDTKEKWNPDIPPIFSGETIIAQSAWQALKMMGAEKQYPFYYSDLYATFFWHHKNVAGQMFKFVIKSPKRTLWLLQGILHRFYMKIMRIERPVQNYKELEDVHNLMDAKDITEKMSEGIEYSFV